MSEFFSFEIDLLIVLIQIFAIRAVFGNELGMDKEGRVYVSCGSCGSV